MNKRLEKWKDVLKDLETLQVKDTISIPFNLTNSVIGRDEIRKRIREAVIIDVCRLIHSKLSFLTDEIITAGHEEKKIQFSSDKFVFIKLEEFEKIIEKIDTKARMERLAEFQKLFEKMEEKNTH